MSASVAAKRVSGVQDPKTGTEVRPRVVITGFESATAQDVAAAFAGTGARLVLQSAATTDAVAAAAGRLAERAPSISLVSRPLASQDDAQALVQAAVRALGGVDTVVSIVEVTPDDLDALGRTDDFEDGLADLLAGALNVCRVAGNRMAVTWTKGVVVNVLVLPGELQPRTELLSRVVKSALASMTRIEAERFADAEIRVVAVAARTGSIGAGCVPDLFALLGELTAPSASDLSGVVYEATLGV